MGTAMSAEERGKDEGPPPVASSNELTVSESADLENGVDVTSDVNAAAEGSDAVQTPAQDDVSDAAAQAPKEAQAEANPDGDAASEKASSGEVEVPADDLSEPVIGAPALALEESAPEEMTPADHATSADAAEEGEPADNATETVVNATAEADEPASSQESPPSSQKEEPKFKRGQVYQGVISKTTPTAVFVDLGDGDHGKVPGRELELMTRKMLESLVVGASVDVYVVNPRNHRGETILSINHALEELDWRNAEAFAKSKQVYEATIGGYNKGGLIVRFGRLRGFVPQSQLSEERVRGMSGATPEERYGPMVNQPVGVKVMEVDRQRNRLILSERAAIRDVRQQRKEALIAELNVGDIRQGKVVSLENFGAFVDIGGGEGLIHLSELAWGHITHPRQAVKVGDEVEVEVISVNAASKRIGLSRRRVISDPWDEIATSLRRGQLVRGRVTKLTKFGAFARLIDHDAVEGLIHISELASERVTHPREVVNRGDELVLRIVKIDIKDRRLGLSLKSVNSTEFLDLDWEMALEDSATLAQNAEAAPAPAEVENEDQPQ